MRLVVLAEEMVKVWKVLGDEQKVSPARPKSCGQAGLGKPPHLADRIVAFKNASSRVAHLSRLIEHFRPRISRTLNETSTA
jgi:hypothetical protein